ncbi:ribonuclease mrp subunit rmp1 protein [Rutstroemia sp. NJR-2017a BBW]|nr:ribonuclease mrp subunit rmp1 protein [Rutstroemia sp. NJR-2017a BBW]
MTTSLPFPNPTHTSLHSLSQILHLTHHRNKNQHRLAKWYISFGILRRQVSRLLALVPEHILESKSRGKAKGKTRERERKREEDIQVAVRFMLARVVSGCYLAFSQLVADNQYATLGLMLMGCLARFHRILVGLKVATEEEVEEKAVEDVKKETKVDDIVEDLGEKIVRDQPRGEIDGSSHKGKVQEDEPMEIKTSKPKKRKEEDQLLERNDAKPAKKKRKKKGGDAFDDLFDSLM